MPPRYQRSHHALRSLNSVEQITAAAQDRTQRRTATALRKTFALVLNELHDDGLLNGAPWNDGVDLIGRAYEDLIEQPYRRAKGQFYTPRWAADVMSGWLLARERQLLLDPGCGSGSLTLSAGQHPRRRATPILSVDRDPLAVQMTSVNCQIRELTGITVAESNFLLDDLGRVPDAVICNPPYIRQQSIPPSEKARLHRKIEKDFGIRLSRLAGLPVLFLLRSMALAAEGARIAFITPAHWLDVRYAQPIKGMLLSCTQVEAIILLPERALLFDRTLTTAAITLITKTPDAKNLTTVVRFPATPPDPAIIDAALSGQPRAGVQVQEVRLRDTDSWARPRVAVKSGPLRGPRLAELARIRRGVATGANQFFVLSESRRRALQISSHDLLPCIATPKLIAGVEIAVDALRQLPFSAPRWLLNPRAEDAQNLDAPLGKYLSYGCDVLRIHERGLPSRRRPWFAPEKSGPCPILFTYLNRGAARFVRNRSPATVLNNWLVIEPIPGIDADILWHALQERHILGQLSLRARVYARGLWKVEPSELGDIRVHL